LTRVLAGFRGGILTGEISYTRAGPRKGGLQGAVTRSVFAARRRTPDLARLLRKESSDAVRLNGSKTKHPSGAAMIAATAFAIVGLVVVAFLNRIP
jgi:hypothetical protein